MDLKYPRIPESDAEREASGISHRAAVDVIMEENRKALVHGVMPERKTKVAK